MVCGALYRKSTFRPDRPGVYKNPNYMIKMRRSHQFILLFLLLLSGCKESTSLSEIDDYELRQKHQDCITRKPAAPGAILACENIRGECERRHAALGNYICEG
jgi:hypothetical protein